MFTRLEKIAIGRFLVLSCSLAGFAGPSEAKGQTSRLRDKAVRPVNQSREVSPAEWEVPEEQPAVVDQLVMEFSQPTALAVAGQAAISEIDIETFAVVPMTEDGTRWLVTSDRVAESARIFDVIVVQDHILVFYTEADGTSEALVLSRVDDGELVDVVPADVEYDYVGSVSVLEGRLLELMDPTVDSANQFLASVVEDVETSVQRVELGTLAMVANAAAASLDPSGGGEVASEAACCAIGGMCEFYLNGCPQGYTTVACPCSDSE